MTARSSSVCKAASNCFPVTSSTWNSECWEQIHLNHCSSHLNSQASGRRWCEDESTDNADKEWWVHLEPHFIFQLYTFIFDITDWGESHWAQSWPYWPRMPRASLGTGCQAASHWSRLSSAWLWLASDDQMNISDNFPALEHSTKLSPGDRCIHLHPWFN